MYPFDEHLYTLTHPFIRYTHYTVLRKYKMEKYDFDVDKYECAGAKFI